MSHLTVTSKAFALLACSALLVASIGCSPGTPTDPSSTTQNVVVSPVFVHILSTSGKTGNAPTRTDGATSMMISAQDGGIISNGRVSLEFPPNALSKDTEITIDMLDDGTLGVDFGPHGIQFNRPVVLRMDLMGTSAQDEAETVDTFWWNSEQLWYEKMEKISSSSSNTVSAELHHFSRYKAGIGS